ncbi:MAG: class I SAM-dependent methyltransferase [Woeseiaceae bacterium]|nr:class I SAM-dependent methyltransferase [Woeseiaceae bacterium]
MADPKDIARKFDERYGAPGYHYGTEPSAFIAAQAKRLPPSGRALVPGDGEGRHGVWLAEQGFEVTSFDPSPVGVAKARALAAERGVTIDARVGDFERWDWAEAAYDVVVLTYVHVAPAVRRTGHADAWRALRPGGLLILEGFSSRQHACRKAGATGGPKDPERLFSAGMMQADFPGAEFHVLEDVDEQFEGRTHGGRCAVLHVVAQKPGT